METPNCGGADLSRNGGGNRSTSSSGSIGTDRSDASNDSIFTSFITSLLHQGKPHTANDRRWEAIAAAEAGGEGGVPAAQLGLGHFRLLKKIGSGDIGSVYLAEVRGYSGCYFAVKVMEKAQLRRRKKGVRAETELHILECLDHPFLPSLYSNFETETLTCFVMEFCPGGDLHVLRQKQPRGRFSEPAAKFYLAEVLLALEYLHMMGVVYRDLKPENVLVREDGHIMLCDFDLSLRCEATSPTLIKLAAMAIDGSVSPPPRPSPFLDLAFATCIQPACSTFPIALSWKNKKKKGGGTATQNRGGLAQTSGSSSFSCLDPVSAGSCIQPSCSIPNRCAVAAPWKKKKKNIRGDASSCAFSWAELVAEPTGARSVSLVGTPEYLAPEIIRGDGHGSAVDWWALGIFLYELLHARTPFKGSSNRATLFNVIGQPLTFPEEEEEAETASAAARDLMRRLLAKEAAERLGHHRGASEIKRHPFFQGVNWALIRSVGPPYVPKPPVAGQSCVLQCETDDFLDFDFF